MTCIPTGEGWLYLALVLDLFSRKVVGWAMSETVPQELNLSAMHMVITNRCPIAGLLHHFGLRVIRRQTHPVGEGNTSTGRPHGCLKGYCTIAL